MKRNQKKETHRVIYLAGFTAGLVLFAVTAVIAASNSLSIIEQQLFQYIYGLPDILRPALLLITQFGSMWLWLLLVLALFINNRKHLAIKLLATGALTYALIQIAKVVVNRPRPMSFLPEILHRELFVSGLGFPSGHTAIATAIGLTVLPYLSKKYRLVIAIWIFAVGLSRVYLGVHAPLDIIGGFGVGLSVACGSHIVHRPKKHLDNLAPTKPKR